MEKPATTLFGDYKLLIAPEGIEIFLPARQNGNLTFF